MSEEYLTHEEIQQVISMTTPPPVISISEEAREAAKKFKYDFCGSAYHVHQSDIEQHFQLAINSATAKLTKENEFAAKIYRQQLGGRDQQIETLSARVRELEAEVATLNKTLTDNYNSQF